MLIRELCTAFGVSGCEQEVADLIIANTSLDYTVNSMGNLVFHKPGLTNNKNIMLCAHMDEVGFIVTAVRDGYVKFKPLGGIDTRTLISKSVVIGDLRIKGVIGAKPKHLIKHGEEKVPKFTDLYIDTGNDPRVKIGDYICFDSDYIEFGDSLVKTKALDDRLGCAILLELMKNNYYCNIYYVFTVQEELGCRGAKTACNRLPVDEAIIVEGTTCADMFTDKDYRFSTKLGGGAAISILDSGSYADKELSNRLYKTAIDNEINVQYKQTTMGGNDAAVIHTSNGGIRTAVISVPCRYIHSPVSVASFSDIYSCYNILDEYLRNTK